MNFIQAQRDAHMPVKIIIIRRIPPRQDAEIRPLMLQMRELAHAQPGYIGGETLINYDDPEEKVVISTWQSLGNWNAWLENPQRRQLQERIDTLLQHETYYQIYYPA